MKKILLLNNFFYCNTLIIGIGLDIVNINRIENIIQKYSNKFINRIYTIREIEKSKALNHKAKINYFAKRFAAKEAFSKACGVGIGRGLNFNEIEIINNNLGKPSICINQKIIDFIGKNFHCNKFKIHLTLTDEKDLSIANVIIEKVTL